MPSLYTQLKWCDETLTGLGDYRQEVVNAANNIDAMMNHLRATFFAELYSELNEVYPRFQNAAIELFADIENIEIPYIEKQQNAIIAVVKTMKPV